MLQMPQRSITRFFIPMIDVLTLLFCIYLLMPVVSPSKDAEAEAKRRANEDRLRQLEAELELARKGVGSEKLSVKLLEEIEKLRKERIAALRNRLAIRVLEIDEKTGKLYFRDPERVEITSQAAANELMKRDQQHKGVSNKELYYLILFPRDRKSLFPTTDQLDSYSRWFADVALGFDIPGAAPGKEP